MFKLLIDNHKCTGCQACAVACSYHHRRIFNPRIASLKVYRNGKRGKASVAVICEDSPEQQRGERIPCDGCEGEAGLPLCIWYCGAGAIAVRER